MPKPFSQLTINPHESITNPIEFKRRKCFAFRMTINSNEILEAFGYAAVAGLATRGAIALIGDIAKTMTRKKPNPASDAVTEAFRTPESDQRLAGLAKRADALRQTSRPA